MKRRKPKVIEGAVVAIPLGDGRWVHGQCLNTPDDRTPLYLGVFDDPPREAPVQDDTPLEVTDYLMLGLTDEYPIEDGNWILVGVRPFLLDVPQPVFRASGRLWNLDLSQSREPTGPEEVRRAVMRTTDSPGTFEDGANYFFDVCAPEDRKMGADALKDLDPAILRRAGTVVL